MFCEGDMVLYGTEGVCRLEGTTQRKIGREQVDYYVLKPVYHTGASVLIPTGNEVLISKIHRVLSREEIDGLIHDIPETEALWIEDETQRKAVYTKILSGSDRKAVIRIMKALYQHRRRQAALGKKFHLSDERLLKEAEERLHGEFALILNIQPDQVGTFIADELEGLKKGDRPEPAIV